MLCSTWDGHSKTLELSATSYDSTRRNPPANFRDVNGAAYERLRVKSPAR